MYFFANDVNADHNIFRVLCDYLAFSLLNIVNKQDCNSYTINEYLIDKKIPIERLKKERETLEWFRSIVMIDISKINCEHFSRKQAEAARTLLLGLVKEYDKRIESIKEHDNIDPDKLDALKKRNYCRMREDGIAIAKEENGWRRCRAIEVYRIGYSTGCARTNA